MEKSKIRMGKFAQVDLRDIWTTEAADFTPWLAKEENLELLGDAIGIDLELEAQERNVGPFKADILCKDTGTSHWVLIENQLERTDHTHLGQLLTYAAGLKAVTIVWIARNFTDEHRAALDWLNEITDDSFTFFGIEIELWRIDDSPVGPRFNIICKPNDWTKRVTDAAHQIDDGEVSDTKLMQQNYWAALRQMLIDRKSTVKPQKPLPQHWTNFALGRSYFGMHAAVNTQKKHITVGMSCYGDHAKEHYRLLAVDKATIEKEIGSPLDWEELPNRKESRIAIRLHDVDPTNQSDWPRQHNWLAEKLELFYKVFSQRVKQLDISEQSE